MPTLQGEIVAELKRNREALQVYEEFGPRAAFAVMGIKKSILEGENALASGDVVEQVRALDALRSTKL